MRTDELELLHSFRAAVTEPDPETIGRAYRSATEAGGGRHRALRFGPVPALCASLAAVFVVVLVAAAPWRGGPDVLARASAALASPAAPHVLYENVVIHGRPVAGGGGFTIHLEAWLTSGSPHRFRVVVDGVRGHGAPGHPVEVSGTTGSTSGLSYNAGSGMLVPDTTGFPVEAAALDPAGFISQGLSSGQARVEGTAIVSGRRVLRILLDARLSGGVVSTTLYDVDAHTYRPVRITNSALRPNASPLGFPMASLLELPFFGYMPGTDARYRYSYDFRAFRYLPGTPRNLARADIRAQHPGARIV